MSLRPLLAVSDIIVFSAPTPTLGSPKLTTPPLSPQLASQGPSQLLTSFLTRLPDATDHALIDQAAIDFAFLNSKAARKRLVKVRMVLAFPDAYVNQIFRVFEPGSEEPNGLTSALLATRGHSQQLYA